MTEGDYSHYCGHLSSLGTGQTSHVISWSPRFLPSPECCCSLCSIKEDTLRNKEKKNTRFGALQEFGSVTQHGGFGVCWPHGSSLQGPALDHDQPSSSAPCSRLGCALRHYAPSRSDRYLNLPYFRNRTNVGKDEQQGGPTGPVQPVCGALPAGEDPGEGTDR